MEHIVQLMNISITKTDSGMFFATSENEPTFFVSALDAQALYELIPLAMQEMFKTRHGLDVNAYPTNGGDFAHKPWAAVPKSLIAEAASCAEI